MAPLFQIPGFFQGSYVPTQPENCCCGPQNTVNVNVGAPPTVGPIIDAGGNVVRRTDEAGRLIASTQNNAVSMFQGV